MIDRFRIEPATGRTYHAPQGGGGGYDPGVTTSRLRGAILDKGTGALVISDLASVNVTRPASTLQDGLTFGWAPAVQGGGSSLTDYSGQGRPGAFLGSPAWGSGGLVLSPAAAARVSVPRAGIVSGAFTIYARCSVADPSRLQWIWGAHSSNADGMSLWVFDGRFQIGSWNGGGGGTFAVSAGTTYDLAITSEQTGAGLFRHRLHVDGSLAYERTGSFYTASQSGNLCLGMQTSGDSRTSLYMSGVVEHFVGWSRLLSDAEIAQLSADRTAWMP